MPRFDSAPLPKPSTPAPLPADGRGWRRTLLVRGGGRGIFGGRRTQGVALGYYRAPLRGLGLASRGLDSGRILRRSSVSQNAEGRRRKVENVVPDGGPPQEQRAGTIMLDRWG